jgi:hypothetical protein
MQAGLAAMKFFSPLSYKIYLEDLKVHIRIVYAEKTLQSSTALLNYWIIPQD